MLQGRCGCVLPLDLCLYHGNSRRRSRLQLAAPQNEDLQRAGSACPMSVVRPLDAAHVRLRCSCRLPPSEGPVLIYLPGPARIGARAVGSPRALNQTKARGAR